MQQNKRKLTKQLVDKLASQTTTDTIVWDAEVRNFGVRLKPSGVSSYIVQYRNIHGRSKRKTLGRHGKVTLEQARKLARQVFAEVANGRDPVTERQVLRAAPTMNDLLDRYVSHHLEIHNRPRTQEEFRRILRLHIRPALGSLKAAGVTREDVAKLHRSLAATRRMANTVLSVLSKAFNLAELWGIRPDGSNPVRHIKRYKEEKRDTFCSDADLARLGAVLNQARTHRLESESVRDAILLLALTGCRLSEVISLRWSDIDYESHILNIQNGKTGSRPHIVGAETIEFLRSLPRVEDSPWVVPHSQPDKHLPDYTLKKAWRRIRTRAGLEEVRLHDLRHTVGTFAGQTGANAFAIRDKLGHKTTATTNRYVNHAHAPVRQLSDQVETRIAGALGGLLRPDQIKSEFN